MKKLQEKRVLTNIHLTSHQKRALATVFAASSSSLAYEHITNGPHNLMAAAKILDKLGLLIIHGDDEITITEAGKEVMRSEGLLDDTDTLTDEGQKVMKPKEEEPGAPPEEQLPPMESFTLMKEINFLTSINKN